MQGGDYIIHIYIYIHVHINIYIYVERSYMEGSYTWKVATQTAST